MQAKYPNKLSTIHWDTLNVQYPVKQFLHTGTSSETTARTWRNQPEVLKQLKQKNHEEIEYNQNYNLTDHLMQSQSTVDHGYKLCERGRFNKHTSMTENNYVYPPSRKVSDRVPAVSAHQTTEMRYSYTSPTISSRLVTDKDQYKNPNSLPVIPPDVTLNRKELEPLDTTYEGYEKYLDPYLTTSRLYHRPYTAHELTKTSNSRDIMTYYTYAEIPWVRVTRPKTDQWSLPISRTKSMFDREKFKDYREIRTHNRLRWVPGTFRTETRDNFVQQTSRPESRIHNYEEEVRTLYQRAAGQLTTNIAQEHLTILQGYSTENSTVGSGQRTCVVFDPYVEKNKRLARKSLS